MLKTFRYRIYPTGNQTNALEAILEECRFLYNHFLEERKTAFEETGKSPSYFEQKKECVSLKESRPSLELVHSQVLQDVALRVDLAFDAFFRRVKAGEKPGYPRFKGKGRYDSITFPQVPSGCSIQNGKLYVSKVGHIKIVLHREMKGIPKTAIIKKSATGKWYVTFSCEAEPKRLPKNEEVVGIDVGLHSFTTLSTGREIDNPRFFRKEEKELAKGQRKLSKEEKCSPGREKRKKVVARIHERIKWRRENFAHQLSRLIVNCFGIICIEDLEVSRMVHNHCLAKSIHDAAWSLFFAFILYKAEEAGRVVIKVNPAYTSQTCSQCGHRLVDKLTLADRVFHCPSCYLVMDRDLNAAKNIVRLGLQSLRIQSVEAQAL